MSAHDRYLEAPVEAEHHPDCPTWDCQCERLREIERQIRTETRFDAAKETTTP